MGSVRCEKGRCARHALQQPLEAPAEQGGRGQQEGQGEGDAAQGGEAHEEQSLGREGLPVGLPEEQHGGGGERRGHHEHDEAQEAIDHHAGRGRGRPVRVRRHRVPAHHVASNLRRQEIVEELGDPLVGKEARSGHLDVGRAQQHAPFEAAHGDGGGVGEGAQQQQPLVGVDDLRPQRCRVFQPGEEEDEQPDGDDELEDRQEMRPIHDGVYTPAPAPAAATARQGVHHGSTWVRERTTNDSSPLPRFRRTSCTFCFCVQAMFHTTWRSRFTAKSYQPSSRL